MFKGILDVLNVDIIIGKVDNFAVVLIFGGAVHPGYRLNRIDPPDLFIQEEGMQPFSS